ncbi:MAG: imidazoleglycerol-phosphate dehydratase [Ignisphaera sp.]
MSRQCRYSRDTLETFTEVYIDIDSEGEIRIDTPIPFLNHMLETLFKHMNSSATIKTVDKKPYDDHHIVEDTAIAIGEALAKCIEDKSGIKRYSHVIVPMDDALVLVAVDVSGRGGSYIDLDLEKVIVGGMSTENVSHFIDTLATRSKITIHVLKIKGHNTHHIIEAVFKGLGLALHDATRIIGSGIKSTKGVI